MTKNRRSSLRLSKAAFYLDGGISISALKGEAGRRVSQTGEITEVWAKDIYGDFSDRRTLRCRAWVIVTHNQASAHDLPGDGFRKVAAYFPS